MSQFARVAKAASEARQCAGAAASRQQHRQQAALAIIRALLAAHGGGIELRDDARGTRWCLHLPRAEEEV